MPLPNLMNIVGLELPNGTKHKKAWDSNLLSVKEVKVQRMTYSVCLGLIVIACEPM